MDRKYAYLEWPKMLGFVSISAQCFFLWNRFSVPVKTSINININSATHTQCWLLVDLPSVHTHRLVWLQVMSAEELEGQD